MSSAPPPAFQLVGIGKAYHQPVLQDITLDLHPGEVHALVGENGAGKSTLSRILSGLTTASAGYLLRAGQPFAPTSRKDAEEAGVHLVLQELNLLPTLTVAENIFFDALPHRWGWIDRSALRARAGKLLKDIGLTHLDPDQPVASLGVGEQQLVEIVSRLWRPCRLMILDEPTAALTDRESQLLFAQIHRLRTAGAAILYISHRLDEVRMLADRITVLRDGQRIATRPTAEYRVDELVTLMVGRELAAGTRRVGRSRGEVVLRVRNLNAGPRVRDVSLDLHRGEILGLAGLMGAGRTETLRALYGAEPVESGTVEFCSAKPSRYRLQPHEAVRRGVALVPEDRKTQALFLPLSVETNLTLPMLSKWAHRGGWISAGQASAAALAWIQRLGIKCASPRQAVGELSGGNQQKVILARWALRDADILLIDEPTRGVDVGARAEIYRVLGEMADRGKALLVVSSELPELMALCDRLIVMSAGRITGEFERGRWTQDQVMQAALLGHGSH